MSRWREAFLIWVMNYLSRKLELFRTRRIFELLSVPHNLNRELTGLGFVRGRSGADFHAMSLTSSIDALKDMAPALSRPSWLCIRSKKVQNAKDLRIVREACRNITVTSPFKPAFREDFMGRWLWRVATFSFGCRSSTVQDHLAPNREAVGRFLGHIRR